MRGDILVIKGPRSGFFDRIKHMSIITYLKETKSELSHVNWPSRRQSIAFTIVVIIVSVITAFLLGFFDFVFSRILNLFI